MAILIKTDGRTSEVSPVDKKRGFSDAEVHEIIGCRVIDHIVGDVLICSYKEYQ